MTPTVFDEPSSDLILAIEALDGADSVSSCSNALGAILRAAACEMISRSRRSWREQVEDGAEASLTLPSLDVAEADLRISSARPGMFSDEASACEETLAGIDCEGERKASLVEPIKLEENREVSTHALTFFDESSKGEKETPSSGRMGKIHELSD